MLLQQRIQQHFADSISVKRNASAALASVIAEAAEHIAERLKAGAKLLACGNGGSAADAQHFVAEIVGRFERERSAMPAIALTTDSSVMTSIANDYAFDQVYARQVQALGQAGDVLIAISTSGNSANVLNAIAAAQQRDLRVIGLSGRDGGEMRNLLTERDVEIRVPDQRTIRIQETHILIIHCLCDLIDHLLFDEEV